MSMLDIWSERNLQVALPTYIKYITYITYTLHTFMHELRAHIHIHDMVLYDMLAVYNNDDAHTHTLTYIYIQPSHYP